MITSIEYWLQTHVCYLSNITNTIIVVGTIDNSICYDFLWIITQWILYTSISVNTWAIHYTVTTATRSPCDICFKLHYKIMGHYNTWSHLWQIVLLQSTRQSQCSHWWWSSGLPLESVKRLQEVDLNPLIFLEAQKQNWIVCQ